MSFCKNKMDQLCKADGAAPRVARLLIAFAEAVDEALRFHDENPNCHAYVRTDALKKTEIETP